MRHRGPVQVSTECVPDPARTAAIAGMARARIPSGSVSVLKSARKADSSTFGTSYAPPGEVDQMAVVRREAWWILFSLVAGALMGGGVMIYAALRVVDATP